jgi:hypothetical protein
MHPVERITARGFCQTCDTVGPHLAGRSALVTAHRRIHWALLRLDAILFGWGVPLCDWLESKGL